MHYIAIIGFVVIGMLAVGLALAHEIFWWRRRGWNKHEGVVTGYKTDPSMDGATTYPAEIEYDVDGEIRTFTAQYSSSKKPSIGQSMPIVVSPDGREAAMTSESNRLIFTLVPLIIGVIFITIGLYVEPIGEQDGADEAATAPKLESNSNDNPKPESKERTQ